MPAKGSRSEPLRLSHLIWLLGSLISVAGIALPIAHVYREGYSGKPIGEYPIVGDRGAARSFELDLHPDMNPLRFVVSGKLVRASSELTGYAFRGTLYFGRDVIATQTWSFSGKKDEDTVRTNSHLDAFSIQKPGRYRYEVSGPDRHPDLRSMALTARRNVRTLSWWHTLGWAAGLLAGGFLLSVMGDKPPFMQRAEEAARQRSIEKAEI